MSSAPSRMVLRHNRLVARRSTLRHASTTSEATQAASNTATKGKETASAATSKASDGLSKVTSSAGPALSGAAQGVSNSANQISGRIGRFIRFAQSMYPPAVYYSKVGLELSKLVFQGQKMTPPSLQAFQPYAQPLINIVRHPASVFTQASTSSAATPEGILSRIRNMDSKQLASAGVVGAEVLGFFTVGEMIGRFKLVGYRGDTEHHETATTTH